MTCPLDSTLCSVPVQTANIAQTDIPAWTPRRRGRKAGAGREEGRRGGMQWSYQSLSAGTTRPYVYCIECGLCVYARSPLVIIQFIRCLTSLIRNRSIPPIIVFINIAHRLHLPPPANYPRLWVRFRLTAVCHQSSCQKRIFSPTYSASRGHWTSSLLQTST